MSQVPEDHAAIQRMWEAFKKATGTRAKLTGAFAFGSSPAMADKLAELVRSGPKRATAALQVDYERDGEPVPRPDDHWVVLDGRGQPVCIIRTTAVEIKPLSRVDAAFAWDEGEGDRSLAWWQQVHHRHFREVCEQLDVPFSEDLPTVFERFHLVWPPRSARDDGSSSRAVQRRIRRPPVGWRLGSAVAGGANCGHGEV